MNAVNVNGIPGWHTPQASWEQPFDMLHACHERASRMLALLIKLQVHVVQNGIDSQAVQAAQDVMRYFDLAAPLHHRDEEEHVFPVALCATDAAVVGAVQQLASQHALMEAVWKGLRLELRALIAALDTQTLPPAWRNDHLVGAFASLYSKHIAVEEGLVYPFVRQQVTAHELQIMGQAMAARRTQARNT